MPKLTKLKEVMDAKAYTMESLAAKSGLSTRTIWSAQKGQKVSAMTARAICRACSVKIESLQGDKE